MLTINRYNNAQMRELAGMAERIVTPGPAFMKRIMAAVDGTDAFGKNYRSKLLAKFEAIMPEDYAGYWDAWRKKQEGCDVSTAFRRILNACGKDRAHLIIPIAASLARNERDRDLVLRNLAAEIDRICPTAHFILSEKARRARFAPGKPGIRGLKEKLSACVDENGILECSALCRIIHTEEWSPQAEQTFIRYADWLRDNCTGVSDSDMLLGTIAGQRVFSDAGLRIHVHGAFLPLISFVKQFDGTGNTNLFEAILEAENLVMYKTLLHAAGRQDLPMVNLAARILAERLPDVGKLHSESFYALLLHDPVEEWRTRIRKEHNLPVWKPLDADLFPVLDRLGVRYEKSWTLAAADLIEQFRKSNLRIITNEEAWKAVCSSVCRPNSREYFLDMWVYDYSCTDKTLARALKTCTAGELIEAQYEKSPDQASRLYSTLYWGNEAMRREAESLIGTDTWTKCGGFELEFASETKPKMARHLCANLVNGLPEGCTGMTADHVARAFGTQRAAIGKDRETTSVLELLSLMKSPYKFPADLVAGEIGKTGLPAILAKAAEGNAVAAWTFTQALGCNEELRREALSMLGSPDWRKAGGSALHKDIPRTDTYPRLREAGFYGDAVETLEKNLTPSENLQAFHAYLKKTICPAPKGAEPYVDVFRQIAARGTAAYGHEKMIIALHVLGPETCLAAVDPASGSGAELFNHCLVKGPDALRKRALLCIGTDRWLAAGGFALYDRPGRSGLGETAGIELVVPHLMESAVLDPDPQRLERILREALKATMANLPEDVFALLVARFVSAFAVGFEYLEGYVSPKTFKVAVETNLRHGFPNAGAIYADPRVDARYAR